MRNRAAVPEADAQSDMKRLLLIIAICLPLGAGVNVAVAWGCGKWSYKTAGAVGRLSSHADWPRAVPPDWPQPTFRATGSGLGVTYVYLSEEGMYAQWIWQWGWPLRGLESEAHSRAWSSRASVTIRPPRPISPAHGFLRICPVWPGFAINTILYAAMVWPLIRGPFALCRFLRLRRGLCPKCAYPMGESSVCTECGIALSHRRQMPSTT